MNESIYTIRTARREEVDIAVDWAASEGWNPGLHDAACYFTIDPQGFLIGLLGAEPVATISAVKYGNRFGFLGFYIVHPEYRGQGYGMRIWQAALDYLQGCDMGLDGVVARQGDYSRSGFELAFRNARHEGTGGGPSPAHVDIVALDSVALATIIAYDQAFFPADRSRFMQAWIRQPDGTALGIMEAGKLAGYGVMRACRSGYKIGPLFADTPEHAEALFLGLRSAAPAAAPVYLDVPEANPAAVALAQRHGMRVVFETVRMYVGPAPAMPLERIFGITSFEVG